MLREAKHNTLRIATGFCILISCGSLRYIHFNKNNEICHQIESVSGRISYSINQSNTNSCWQFTSKQFQNKYILLRIKELRIVPFSEHHRPSQCENWLGFTQSSQLQYGNTYSAYSPGVMLPDVVADQQWCGMLSPGDVWIRSDSIALTMYTHNYPYLPAHFSGFSLDYKRKPVCWKNVRVSDYQFITAYDVNGGLGGLFTCDWNISAQHPNLPLQVYVNRWNWEVESRLYVYDGASDQAKLLHVWSSMDMAKDLSRPAPPTSTSNMFLRLETRPVSTRTSVLFHLTVNITVKLKGYCLPGTHSCGDQQTCYTTLQKCDGERDCPHGQDEIGCGKCYPDYYWCGGKETDCVSQDKLCDGRADCENLTDERQCDWCGENAFFCKSTRKCIYELYRCDNVRHCTDGSDEEGCVYRASRRVITAAVIGSLVCGLLLAIALGCSLKLYTLRNQHAARHTAHRSMLFNTPLGRIARELLRREAPPSYDMAVTGSETAEPPPHRRHHAASCPSAERRRRNRRRRRRRREPQLIRRSRPNPVDVAITMEQQRNNNNLMGGEQEAAEEQSATSLPPPVQQPSSSPEDACTSFPAHPPSTTQLTPDAVLLALAEVGLTEFPPPRPARHTSHRSSRQNEAPMLPVKKSVRPVLVPAPCHDAAPVDDIAACVYPNPPTYSEALTATPPPTVVEVADPVMPASDEHKLPAAAHPRQSIARCVKRALRVRSTRYNRLIGSDVSADFDTTDRATDHRDDDRNGSVSSTTDLLPMTSPATSPMTRIEPQSSVFRLSFDHNSAYSFAHSYDHHDN